jgi:PAS domain S-box-containing protein
MKALKVLIVEDSRADFVLLTRAIKKDEIEFEFELVSSLALLQENLQKPWDLIITDYHLPGFNATDVIRMANESANDVPLIVVSGALREEEAVDLMVAGAKDFVRKDNLARLAPAIQREIAEAQIRKAKKAAELALAENQKRTRQLIEMLPQLVWTSLPNGECDFLSPQWVNYTGLTAEQQLGFRWIDTVVHPEDREETRQHLSGAVEGRHKYDTTFRIRDHFGEYRWFKARGIPVKDERGEVTYWFGTCTDIHDQKMNESELKIAKEQAEFAKTAAENANATKSAFLANMSHELRTPLGAIIGYCEVLQEENLPIEERDRYLQIVIRNSKGLTRIIDDILDLAKVEAGKLEVEEIEFSFFELLSQSIDLFKDKAIEKGLFLLLNIDESVPQYILSDPTRLRQILTNIIGNAIKFTTEGGVRVAVKAITENDGRAQFQISVKDSGIGLNFEQKERLFQPFMQADNSTNRKFGGTGLGLVVSQRLAIALGGDITIDDGDENEGSSFTIRFQGKVGSHGSRAQSQLNTTKTSTGEPPTQRLLGKRVLLAEDSLDNQLLVKRLLSKHGAEVDIANDGEEAISKAISTQFDVILMDIQMPRVDGYEATRALRKNGYVRPIIALTAHAMLEDRVKTKNAGCDAHLTKPLNSAEVIGIVESFSGANK